MKMFLVEMNGVDMDPQGMRIVLLHSTVGTIKVVAFFVDVNLMLYYFGLGVESFLTV